jgi:monoamine oxidase
MQGIASGEKTVKCTRFVFKLDKIAKNTEGPLLLKIKKNQNRASFLCFQVYDKKIIMVDVIIIGAGLSGLTTAYYLQKHNISCKILEAQSRIGGRIDTQFGKLGAPMEMGATWFGVHHEQLIQLLKTLNIATFPQHGAGKALFQTLSFGPPQQFYVPASDVSSFRIAGGTHNLIKTLYKSVGSDNILLDATIKKIEDTDDFLTVFTDNGQKFHSRIVVSALPPQLQNNIQFEPNLPKELSQIFKEVHTWMSGSVKFGVEYTTPFWRNKGFSGTVYSQIGLAVEIYDHSNFENTKYALVGFLNGSASHYPFEQREKIVIQQLIQLFGEDAANYTAYLDKIWTDKYIMPEDPLTLLPHQNNGHSLLQKAYLNGKFFLAGTETATTYGGYMEGAIATSQNTAERVLSVLKK